MRHLLLPPSDDQSRDIQIPFLNQINKIIENYSNDDETKEKLKLFVFEILTLLDGFYVEFPRLKIVSIDTETLVSGDLHDLFHFMFMCPGKTS